MKWLGITVNKILGLTLETELGTLKNVMLGVLEGLTDCNYDGTTLSFIYGTLLYTSEVTLLGYLITNIPGDLESNPLEESETITENYLVGLIFCSVTVSSRSMSSSKIGRRH